MVERKRLLEMVIAISVLTMVVLFLSSSLFKVQAAQNERKNLQSLFSSIQTKGADDPDFRFVVEYYAPGPGSVSVVAITGSAAGIVDVGEDYICVNDIIFDDQPPSADICIPFTSVVRIRTTNTLFE